MSKLERTFEDYLSRIDRLDELGMGEQGDGGRTASNDDSNYLARALDHNLRINKYVVLGILACLGILFVIAASILISYRNDVRALYIVLALLLLSNFGIIRWLRQLWWELNIMDISLSVVRELPPEQPATSIGHLYWDFLRSSFANKTKKPFDGNSPPS